MTSLSQRDKYLLIAILVIGVIVGIFYLVVTPIQKATATTNEEIAALEGKVGQLDSLNDRAAQLSTRDQKLTESINDKNITSFKTINKQEFIVFLTTKCKDHGIELTEFEDLGTTQSSNGTWKSMYDFQIRASHADILKLCDDIDGLGIDYNVTSISLRQNLTLPWTERLADKVTNTPWYIDNTKSAEEESALLNAVQKLQEDVNSMREDAMKKREDEEQRAQEYNESTQSSSSNNIEPAPSESNNSKGNEANTPNQAIDNERITNPVDIGTRLESLLGIGGNDTTGSGGGTQSAPQTQEPVSKPTSKPTSKPVQQQPTRPATTVEVPDAVTVTEKDVKVTQEDYYDGTMLFNITIEFVMYSDPYMNNNANVDVITSEYGFDTDNTEDTNNSSGVNTETATIPKKENE